jgi:hypothetical protein
MNHEFEQFFLQDLDWCMALIIGPLVQKLSNTKITIRRVTVACLLQYLKLSGSPSTIQKVIIAHVRDLNRDRDTNTLVEVLRELVQIFVKDVQSIDFTAIVDGLTRLLLDCDELVVDATLRALEKVVELGRE